eukprot:m.183897 g.183897  ORF g.183897 m.183897 type:complete len:528 (+) comp16900_c0_seq1:1665-3248(+)
MCKFIVSNNAKMACTVCHKAFGWLTNRESSCSQCGIFLCKGCAKRGRTAKGRYSGICPSCEDHTLSGSHPLCNRGTPVSEDVPKWLREQPRQPQTGDNALAVNVATTPQAPPPYTPSAVHDANIPRWLLQQQQQEQANQHQPQHQPSQPSQPDGSHVTLLDPPATPTPLDNAATTPSTSQPTAAGEHDERQPSPLSHDTSSAAPTTNSTTPPSLDSLAARLADLQAFNANLPQSSLESRLQRLTGPPSGRVVSEDELRARFGKLTDGRLPLPSGHVGLELVDDELTPAEEAAAIVAQAQEEARLDADYAEKGVYPSTEREPELTETDLELIARGQLPAQYSRLDQRSRSGAANVCDDWTADREDQTRQSYEELAPVDEAVPLTSLVGTWDSQGDSVAERATTEAEAVLGDTRAQLDAMGIVPSVGQPLVGQPSVGQQQSRLARENAVCDTTTPSSYLSAGGYSDFSNSSLPIRSHSRDSSDEAASYRPSSMRRSGSSTSRSGSGSTSGSGSGGTSGSDSSDDNMKLG